MDKNTARQKENTWKKTPEKGKKPTSRKACFYFSINVVPEKKQTLTFLSAEPQWEKSAWYRDIPTGSTGGAKKQSWRETLQWIFMQSCFLLILDVHLSSAAVGFPSTGVLVCPLASCWPPSAFILVMRNIELLLQQVLLLFFFLFLLPVVRQDEAAELFRPNVFLPSVIILTLHRLIPPQSDLTLWPCLLSAIRLAWQNL